MSRRLQEGRDRLEARAAATDTTTTYKVEVATEADYEYVQYWGGSATAANREIRAILNQVEGVYETELKLKLEIIYQHAWTQKQRSLLRDGRTSNCLEQFARSTGMPISAILRKDYDLAHLWTDREVTFRGRRRRGNRSGRPGLPEAAAVCHNRGRFSQLWNIWSYGYSRRYTQTVQVHCRCP